ncbi:hypothetical protein C8J56DRAFT_799628 [Mycena floridula]|nr:hypothetical protein C8J56DRAFT_799628 [Mycena floridula]
MSRAAKATLTAAICFSAAIVWGVHFQQQQERETMYQGVLRDDERRREKQLQRMRDFEESKQKRELYERVQRVEQPKES